jgi:glycosyltransferase involved in cell wall biosynthesis
MQKTSFNFEILVNDDASNDGTADVLKEYRREHPDKFELVFHKENLFSQGKKNFFARFLLPKAKGKYIALCEGDDYWTDPNKLQIQADFMDSHPKYSLCFHKSKVVYENGININSVYPDVEDTNWYSKKELLQTNFIATNTVMYRKQDYADIEFDVSPSDWYLHLYHAQFGEIGFINKIMSVYRKHEGSMYWEYDNDRDKIWKTYGLSYLNLQNALLKIYGDNEEYRIIINQSIYKMIDTLISIDEKYGTELFAQAAKKFPEKIKEMIFDYHQKLEDKNKEIEGLKKELLKVGDERNELANQAVALTNELNWIKQTRTWKTRTKLANAKSKAKRK